MLNLLGLLQRWAKLITFLKVLVKLNASYFKEWNKTIWNEFFQKYTHVCDQKWLLTILCIIRYFKQVLIFKY